MLVQAVRKICKQENAKRDWSFVDQITRAARSVSANIAEGSDAMTAGEFIQFLGYAKRSNAEVRSHLYDALDEGYITKSEFESISLQTMQIGRMISKFIQYLQSANKKKKYEP